MAHRTPTSPPHYNDSDRLQIVERDLYHLDVRLTDLTGTVDAAHNRLHALSERIKRAEWQLDATTTSLVSLQKHTTNIAETMPDIEGIIRMIRWLVEAIKYILGMAILAGAVAGGQGVEALKALFG